MFKRGILVLMWLTISLLGFFRPVMQASAEPVAEAEPTDLVIYSAYELRFESVISYGNAESKVSARVLIPGPGGEGDRCGGAVEGDLIYDYFHPPLPCTPLTTDAILRVLEAPLLTSPAQDRLLYTILPFGGLWSIANCSPIPFRTKHWYAAFVVLHQNELTGKGILVTDWTYPGGDVYARKVYDRTVSIGDRPVTERTVFELIEREPPVRIQEIFAYGADTGYDKDCSALTGQPVRLQADMVIPPEYEVIEYLWQGDLSPATGDRDAYGLHTYTPALGDHGHKTITLVVTYRHKESGATGCTRKQRELLVHFDRDGDDDGDGLPNWFEYWGRDGAVPGLDAPDVKYDPNAKPVGYYNPNDDQIYLGPEVVGGEPSDPLTFPTDRPDCPVGGQTNEYKRGVELAAVTLVHERHHKWQEAQYETPPDQGGWKGLADTDGDGVPDEHEIENLGTSPTNPDSCGLGELRCYDANDDDVCGPNEYSPYRRIGDRELGSRLQEKNAVYDKSKDFGYPGPLATFQCPDTIIINEASARQAPPVLAGSPRVADAPVAPGFWDEEFAQFTGVVGEDVVDDDGDGRYDGLVLDVEVDTAQAAPITVVGWLEDGSGTPIATTSTQAELDVGTGTVPLRFSGLTIHASGRDGPYTLARAALRVDFQMDGGTLAVAENLHTTAAYAHTDFEALPAVLSGWYTETGIDNDGDGLYNLLRYRVGLEVRETGVYTVTGQLVPSGAGEPVLAVASNAVSRNVGRNRRLNLDFDGRAIHAWRRDGPYQLGRLWVTDETGQITDLAVGVYETGAYGHDAFEHGSTILLADGYSSEAVDEDDDGRYEALEVEISLESDQGRGYRVLADLKASDGTPIIGAATTVAAYPPTAPPVAGDEIVFEPTVFTGTLRFDGAAIRASDKVGPYTVANVTLADLAGVPVDRHPVAHTTAAYRYDAFDSPWREVALPLLIKE